MIANSGPTRGWLPWAVLALSVLTGSASAHDVWIVPPDDADVDQLTRVHLRSGHNGHDERVRRNERRLARLVAIGPDGEEVTVPGLHGSDPAGVFRPDQSGLWTIVYESHDALSELSAERFRAHLEEEGLDAILELRQRAGQDGEPGRELYSRSLKSLMRVGPEHDADRAVGLPLELVVETEPELWTEGAIRLQLLLHGEPLAGALIEARRLAHQDPALTARTDSDGLVDLALTPGTWMAAVVHMEVEPESQRADWRSLFATLTWEIPG